MASWAKNLNIDIERALYDISYQNLLLYNAALPSYDDEEDLDESIDANNPKNFNDTTEEIFI